MPALFATTGPSGTAIGTATVTAADDTLTLTAHGLVAGQQVVTYAATGGAVGVLVPQAPYYVASPTTNTFQLRSSPGGSTVAFSTDGTVSVDAAESVYTAQVMRQGFGGLLYKARPLTPNVGRFGARWGVLQNGAAIEVSVSGMTVTNTDLNCVINTAGSEQRGPYLCAIPTSQITLSPSHPTLGRIDTLIAEVLDDAADSSGDLIPGRTRILEGTPASVPVAPTVPDGTLELAQFSIAAGSSSATGTYTAPFTVAAGGILPVRDAAGLPAGTRREGMYADQADINALVRWSGTDWEPMAYAGFPTPVTGSNNSSFAALTNTTFAGTSTPAGVAFVAPPTGRGLLIVSARVTLAVTGTVDRIALGTPWLGTGPTINSGAAVAIEGVTPPDDTIAFIEARNDSNTAETHIQARGAETYVVTGLSSGVNYNASIRYRVTSGTSASYTVDRQRVRWVPLR